MKKKSIFKKIAKIFLGFIIAIIGLILILMLITQISPLPVSVLIKKAFEQPPQTPPANFQTYENMVDISEDVSYQSEYKHGNMDIYLPNEEQEGGAPVILWMHGGAFVGGDKSDISIYSTMLAANGYAVFSINYSLAPNDNYPVPIIQLEEAYKFISENSQGLPIDTSRFFFAGDSAGAQIVSQFMLIQTNEDYAKKIGMPQTVPPETIKGVLLYCGPYNIEHLVGGSSSSVVNFFLDQVGWSYLGEKNWKNSELAKEVSIVNYVTADFPPAFITDGNTGSFEQHGKELAKALEALGVEISQLFFSDPSVVTYHEYQFLLSTKEGEESLERTLAFLREALKEEKINAA